MQPALLLVCFALSAPADPPQDFDKDGIVDLEDDCPTDPGDKAANGCPAGMPEPPKENKPHKIEIKGDRLDVSERVQFRSGSASVDPASFGLLKSIAISIQALPATAKVIVAGHTDDRGNKKANVKLSEDRARAVIAHLVRAGVAQERLTPQGHGPNKPVAPNNTEEGRTKNRRVEFLIVQ